MAKRPIFYDTETTGIKAEKDRIIEIAAFDPYNNCSFCEFVNPGMPIPLESQQICGITDEMVKDAKNFKEIAPLFFDFCQGDVVLIAHNNDSFDKFFLLEECKRHNLNLPDFPYIDSLKWARKYRPDLPRHNLQYLRELFQIKENRAHRALDDVIILMNVFFLMVEDLTMDEVWDLLYQTPTISPTMQMPFGKHKGEPLSKLPKGYLKWLATSGALDKRENENLKSSLVSLGLLGHVVN